MSDYYKDEVNIDLWNLVEKDFFDGRTLALDRTVHAQKIRDDCVVIGPWAGPVADMEVVLHEMGHFVEIDTRRMCQYGWGLKWGKPWRIGTSYGEEFWTDQSVRREIRVWAIQCMLMTHYGLHVDVAEVTKSCTFLAAMPLYGTEDALRDHVNSLIPTYSMDWFKAEWNRRSKLIRRRQLASRRRCA